MSTSVYVDGPFADSLAVLALAAMQDAGAIGFACFRNTEDGRSERFCEFGTYVDEHSFSELGAPATIRFSLHRDGVHDGVLAFLFSTKEESVAVRDRLFRFVSTIQKVWEAQSIPRSYRNTLECIIDMEMKLSDSKIASHVRGVLHENAGRSSMDAIFRHVETVLRPSSTMRALNQMHQELKEKVEERNWTEQAKAILQDSRGMTEEEAYSQLRRFTGNRGNDLPTLLATWLKGNSRGRRDTVKISFGCALKFVAARVRLDTLLGGLSGSTAFPLPGDYPAGWRRERGVPADATSNTRSTHSAEPAVGDTGPSSEQIKSIGFR